MFRKSSNGISAIALCYLLGVHVLALVLFSLFRLVLFLSADYNFPPDIAGDYQLYLVAFVRGLWFDNVIACYILVLPLTVFWIAGCLGCASKWLYRSSAWFFVTLYSLSFIVAAANIPYFNYFFKPINSSVFNWFDYVGTTAGMVFGETSYYLPMALALAAIAIFSYAVFKMSGAAYAKTLRITTSWKRKEVWITAVLGALLIGLCIFGIRGRRGRNPIKVSQAYYCTDPFLNQLGVNPVFNMMTSAIDDNRKENQALSLMPADEAIANVRKLLDRKGIDGISPIARTVKADTTAIAERKNVVIILMESMSASLMGTFGNENNLTPYLDSLYRKSLSFSNFYSSGIHTNQGMYSSLYSFPAIMKRNAMKGTVIPQYSGLPTVLKQNGYSTMFFMTHESQYDNMNAFFRTNGFDEIYSQENYPTDKVVNGFGVQDDYLFQYALPVLDKHAASDKPFFSVLLTISNHPPYVIPPYFHPHSTDKEKQIVEYADWSIRNFMTEVLKRPWADNTIFVLMADHGKLVGTPECESPLSYNHIPLMIFGKGIEPRVISNVGGQVDLAPTLLGLLNIGYTQNGFGVDLLKEKRPYMFFTADNLIGVRDSSRLYIYIPGTRQELRYHVVNGTKVTPAKDDVIFRSMKGYGFSMLQCAEILVRRQQTLDHTKKTAR